MKTKADFLECILGKKIDGHDKEMIEAGVLEQCYETLAYNYSAIIKEKDTNKSAEYTSISKHLLKEMEKKYALRSVFAEQVKSLKEEGVIKDIADINSFKYS